MRRMVSLALVLAMIVSVCLPVMALDSAYDSAENAGGAAALAVDVTAAASEVAYIYAENSDGTLTITGYEGTLPSELVIPAQIDGKQVTAIGSRAFYQTGITDLVISEGVQSISSLAFADCGSLQTVQIPASMTSIGYGFVLGSDSLMRIDVAGENTAYASVDGVLFSKDMTSLIQYPLAKAGAYQIPDGVVTIEQQAFYLCKNLTEVIIPNSVKTIRTWAFSWCTSLKEVTIPASVTTIERSVFEICDSMTDIYVDAENPAYLSQNGVLFTKDQTILVQYPAGRSGSYEIPTGVTWIMEDAFYNRKGLTGITIADTVTFIGWRSFTNCTGLTSITIPASVTTVGDYAFNGCTNLSEITFCGDAPECNPAIFTKVTATAYYPAGNATWTEDVLQNYGGSITWLPLESEEPEPVLVVEYDAANEKLSWNAIEGAASYSVWGVKDGVKKGFTVYGTSVSTRELAYYWGGGTYQVEVFAMGSDGIGFLHTETPIEAMLNIEELAKAENLRFQGEYLVWNAITNADAQVIEILFPDPVGRRVFNSGANNYLDLTGQLTEGAFYHITIRAYNERMEYRPSTTNVGLVYSAADPTGGRPSIGVVVQQDQPGGTATTQSGEMSIVAAAQQTLTTAETDALRTAIETKNRQGYSAAAQLELVLKDLQTGAVSQEALSEAVTVDLKPFFGDTLDLTASGARYVLLHYADEAQQGTVCPAGMHEHTLDVAGMTELQQVGSAWLLVKRVADPTSGTPSVGVTVQYGQTGATVETTEGEKQIVVQEQEPLTETETALLRETMTEKNSEGYAAVAQMELKLKDTATGETGEGSLEGVVTVDLKPFFGDTLDLTRTDVIYVLLHLSSGDHGETCPTGLHEHPVAADGTVQMAGLSPVWLLAKAADTYIPGDINGNGEVNNKDATRLFQYLSGWDVEVVEAALDVNGDGYVNNKDATRLFQYLSGWNVEIH